MHQSELTPESMHHSEPAPESMLQSEIAHEHEGEEHMLGDNVLTTNEIESATRSADNRVWQ